MKVAVTGASGHIGNCLVRELKKQGAEVKVLVHNFRNDLDKLNVELIQGNLLEPESLITLCNGVDVVFHLAAQIAIENRSSEQVYETNVTGTKNMIQAANYAGVKKFIHFSSIHAFRTESSELILDESRSMVESNKTIYEFTKAEGERVVMKAVSEGLCWVRHFFRFIRINYPFWSPVDTTGLMCVMWYQLQFRQLNRVVKERNISFPGNSALSGSYLE
jgi:dihydroflavonol-4-reductase